MILFVHFDATTEGHVEPFSLLQKVDSELLLTRPAMSAGGSRIRSQGYQDYFDGAVIVTEQQQGANVQIRYPEAKMTQRLQRKWQVFPGRNSFYCNGRIVMAQKAGIFYLTVVLIVTTSALFFVFDCPYLTQHISPAIPAVGESFQVSHNFLIARSCCAYLGLFALQMKVHLSLHTPL